MGGEAALDVSPHPYTIATANLSARWCFTSPRAFLFQATTTRSHYGTDAMRFSHTWGGR